MDVLMSDSTATRLSVINICNAWVADGRGDECFWEGWPGEPECESLTPNMVLVALGCPTPTAQE